MSSRGPSSPKPRRRVKSPPPVAKTGVRCRSSPSIRPMPRITMTRSMPPLIPIRATQAATLSVSPSPMWRIMCSRDRSSIARRENAATPSISPTASCRCCPSASPMICARCGRMVIGADGRKRSHSFHRVLIRSAARLHYEQAQLAVSGRTDEITEPIADRILAPLYAAYRAVLRARDERGPLDLDVPERKIVLKSDGTVDRVIMPQRLEAHRLIEEFMILANVAAAETCERSKVPLIYRVHDEPSPEKLNALREFLATLEISLPKGGTLRPDGFNRILARVKGRGVERLVNEVVLRTQAQAEYSSENFGHFGLNLRRYAHFTSPIRRYADLIVHRALIRALELGADGLPDAADTRSLAEIAANISATERRAMKAERETADRLIAHFLADRVGAIFDGHISGVTRAGLFVELDETGADGFIPARSIGEEYFRFHEAGRAFVGRSATHRLGDPVTVELVEAAPVAGALRFRLVAQHADRLAGNTKRAGPAPRHDQKFGGKSRSKRGRRGRARR